MKEIADWLTHNPLVVIIVFVVGMVAGAIGIITGWKTFYREFLAKSVNLPVGLLLIFLALAGCLGALLRNNNEGPRKPNDFTTVVGQKFGVQQVVLDERAFVRCSFEGTELVFKGDGGVILKDCSFDNPRFTIGPVAARTIGFLMAMYKNPLTRPLVEQLFEDIKTGTVHGRVPVTKLD